MQALFQADANNDYSPEGVRLFRENFEVSKNVIPFFSRLTAGVIEHKDEIDQCIHRVSTNWKISRMSRVDRNAMRIAVFEILYCDDIPFKVSIDEAVDLGKKYGTKDSGAFINGILDSIHASATSPP
ncbi:MAG: transcription antitermination factor NusB [Desulfobacterales bacterium C00003104]|jgi:N utilization substance protein B|nr:MAG: transcription antitermination factor NusB [Desulfobacterales bacterium C00003104]